VTLEIVETTAPLGRWVCQVCQDKVERGVCQDLLDLWDHQDPKAMMVPLDCLDCPVVLDSLELRVSTEQGDHPERLDPKENLVKTENLVVVGPEDQEAAQVCLELMEKTENQELKVAMVNLVNKVFKVPRAPQDPQELPETEAPKDLLVPKVVMVLRADKGCQEAVERKVPTEKPDLLDGLANLVAKVTPVRLAPQVTTVYRVCPDPRDPQETMAPPDRWEKVDLPAMRELMENMESQGSQESPAPQDPEDPQEVLEMPDLWEKLADLDHQEDKETEALLENLVYRECLEKLVPPAPSDPADHEVLSESLARKESQEMSDRTDPRDSTEPQVPPEVWRRKEIAVPPAPSVILVPQVSPVLMV